MSEPAIKKALEYQAYFMHDAKLRHKYELQEKAIRDYNSSMLAVKEESLQQGIQIGEKNSMKKMAIKMLARGDSIEDIADMTELSITEIEQLRNKQQCS